MIKLTAADKKKTLVDFLGISGTPEEITKKLEESQKLTELLNALFQDTDETYRTDSEQLTYTFVIDTLCGRLGHPLTIEEIANQRDSLRTQLKAEYAEIQQDYDENGGKKPDLFLKSVPYDTTRDGFNRKSFFFRYWRSPLRKVVAHRGLTPGTPTADNKIKKILRELYSSHLEESTWKALLDETPEHLVEQKRMIEEKQKKRAVVLEAYKNNLPRMQFSEIWTFNNGVYWSPDMAVDFSGKTMDQICDELSRSTEAQQFLHNYLWTSEDPDAELFKETWSLTPRQTQERQIGITEALKKRNDLKYLAVHPTATFQEYAQNRFYSTIHGGPDEQAALQSLIQATQPVDRTAVEQAKNMTCAEIKAKADTLKKELKKRKKRKSLIGTAIAAVALVGAVLGIGMKASTTESQAKPAKAPVEHRATPKKQAQAPKAAINKNLLEKSSAKKNAKQVEAPQEAASEATAPQKKTKTIELRPVVMGNRPIYMDWHAYQDPALQIPAPMAPQEILDGEYRTMLERLEKTGKICAELFDGMVVGRSMHISQKIIYGVKLDGRDVPTFYINPNTRINGRTERDLVIEDIINYNRNMATTLSDLPVGVRHKNKAQVLALKAFGSAIGWAQDQQQIWQEEHEAESHQAYQEIMQGARKLLKQQKSPLTAEEKMTFSVLEATAAYREKHPEHQALALTARDVFVSMARQQDQIRTQGRETTLDY